LHRDSEYMGRQDGDGPQQSWVDKIPGLPFNLHPTANIQEVEKATQERIEAEQKKYTKWLNKLDKQSRKDEKTKASTQMFEQDRQKEYFRYLINQHFYYAVEAPRKVKEWQEESSDEE